MSIFVMPPKRMPIDPAGFVKPPGYDSPLRTLSSGVLVPFSVGLARSGPADATRRTVGYSLPPFPAFVPSHLTRERRQATKSLPPVLQSPAGARRQSAPAPSLSPAPPTDCAPRRRAAGVSLPAPGAAQKSCHLESVWTTGRIRPRPRQMERNSFEPGGRGDDLWGRGGEGVAAGRCGRVCGGRLPDAGQRTRLEWQQNSRNLVMTEVE